MSEGTYQSPFRFDERSVGPVHFVVEAAGVTQVVPRAVPAPERGRCGSTVYTLPAFCEKRNKLQSTKW